MDTSDIEPCNGSDLLHSSEGFNVNPQCEQCQESGLCILASAFCSNCNDYLCTNCVRQHRKLRGLKDHVLLEGTALPKEKHRVSSVDECPEHPQKLVELFCQSDNTLACVLCIAESHRTCPDVKSISKLSKDVTNSKELRDVNKTARKQNKVISSCRESIDGYRALNENCYDKTVEDFETFRTTIEGRLDQLGNRIRAEAGELKYKNKEKLESLSNSLESIQQDMERMMSDIEKKEMVQQADQLFITIKKNLRRMQENKKIIQHLKKDILIPTFGFEIDAAIQHTLDKIANTSTMRVLSGDIKCTEEVNVKTPADENRCSISSIVELSPTMIVLVDRGNDCLKMVDVDRKTVVKRRQLSSKPYKMTLIPGSRVAVSPSNSITADGSSRLYSKIQLFTTDKGLDPCGSIRVDGLCVAIQSTDNALIVGIFHTCTVVVMDFEGNVMQTFSPQLLAESLAVGPDYTNIYVGQSEGYGCVSCLDSNGQVTWQYDGKKLTIEESNERDDGDDEGKKLEVGDVKKDHLDDDNNEEYGYTDDDGVKVGKEYGHIDDNRVENWDSSDESDYDETVTCKGFNPWDVVTGEDGCLYICCQSTNRIHVLSATGVRLRTIPVSQYNVQDPSTICYSKVHKALYVSSDDYDGYKSNSIQRLSFR